MQIVIEINEHIYKQIMADSEVYVLDNEVDRILIENAIYNGTPLPKNHGRLIDADVLEELKEPMYESSGDMKGYGVLMSGIREFAPTIIEEVKADEDDICLD